MELQFHRDIPWKHRCINLYFFFYMEGQYNTHINFYENILLDSCQFNNPGMPFSKTWAPSLERVITRKGRVPISQSLQGSRGRSSISGNLQTHMASTLNYVLQYFPISSPQHLKFLQPFVSAELSSTSLPCCNHLDSLQSQLSWIKSSCLFNSIWYNFPWHLKKLLFERRWNKMWIKVFCSHLSSTE